ncbi:MAG: hypothetical protein GX444_10755 [Myxococcales bacterium]|nr:hypothetical protein [Myxococcales bacterium]
MISSRRRFWILSFILLLLGLPAVASAFSLVSMQPNYDRYLVYTTEPLVLVFDQSLNPATVGEDAVAITDLKTSLAVDGAVSLSTTNVADDTLTFTPTGRFPFGDRLQAAVDEAVEDLSGDGLTGDLPSLGVFAANMPNNLEAPDPSEIISAAAAYYGFNPVDPEGTDPADYKTITGVSVTSAWKMTKGDPSTLIVVVDDGLEDFTNVEIADNVFFNRGELSQPRNGETPCADWDCDGNGRFNARDYENDAAVEDANANGRLDPEDVFAAFEDGVDNDDNGFVDDISGWDFFRNVNRPYGVDEFPEGTHGGGIGEDACAVGDNGHGRAGTCPNCSVMWVRVGDAVVTELNLMSTGLDYARSMGADIVAIANGGVNYNEAAQQAFLDAYNDGLFIVAASGDELGFQHIYPAAGEGAYSIKAVLPFPPVDLFGPINLSLIAFTESYCTNYGAAVETSWSSDQCTSTAVGNAAGALGLLVSWAREQGYELTPKEIRQIANMTSDDIKSNCFSFNLGGCKKGFEQNFGYGRANMKSALQTVGDELFGLTERIPPEVEITSPRWWETYNPLERSTVAVEGTINARGRAYEYEVQVGLGVEPDDNEFETVATGDGTAPTEGLLATVDPMQFVTAAWLRRTPEKSNDFTVTLRVRAWWQDGADKIYGEARKAIAWHTDDNAKTGLLPGFPMEIGASGESSAVLYDLDGDLDGALEIVMATSVPSVDVFKRDSASGLYDYAPGFPVDLPLDRLWPDSVIASTAVGPLFGDGVPYIVVATWYGRIYVVHPDGNNHAGGPFLAGFPVSADDPDNSTPLSYGHGNAFLASPVLADLDLDGILEIIAASGDQKAYAWKPVDENSDGLADLQPGWPVPLDSTEAAGLVDPNKICESDGPAQVLGTPVAAILDPNHTNPDISGHPSVIVATTETCNEGLLPTSRVYAIYWNGLENSDGPFLPDWPAEPLAPLGDSLPIPPLTIGSTSSPAAIWQDGRLLVGVGAFFWIPQMIYWDGYDLTLKHLRSKINLGASAAGAFGKFDDSGTPWYFFPSVGFLQGGNGHFYLEAFNVLGWRLDTPMGKPGIVMHLEDINFFINPVIADLDNDDLNEVIAGSGGYLIHAQNNQQQEPATWPKFTHGWMTGSPAIADLDNDGRLEVIAFTHDGQLYGWRTQGNACKTDKTNGEWPRYHHDPFNSGFYGLDAVPPGMVTDLQCFKTDAADEFELHFSAPGDDNQCGMAAAYDIRYTTDAAADLRDPDVWQAATAVASPEPQLGGSQVITTVSAPGAAQFAVRAYDDENFVSFISNVATPEEPTDDDDDATPDDDTPDDDTPADDDDDASPVAPAGDDDDDDNGCGC